MSAKPNGGPAFPRLGPPDNCDLDGMQSGMTLRQWYAGMTLQGIVATGRFDPVTDDCEVHTAELAFLQADAMIAHEKGPDD